VRSSSPQRLDAQATFDEVPDPHQTIVRVTEVQLLASSQIRTAATHCAGPSPAHPIAPASIWDYTGKPARVFDFHRLVDQRGPQLSFLTFDWHEDLPRYRDHPLEDQEFVLQSWWIPAAWDLVTDKSLTWRREIFAGEHDHCIITWHTINDGDIAYVSNDGDWISVSAYDDFIRDDVLRLRLSDHQ
jgi:hypothetical protein